MNEMQSLADLLDLQKVDSEIDRLLDQRSGVPELEQYRAAHERLAQLTAERDRLQSELRETTLNLDKSTGELELAEAKLHREENRLFAGGIGARDAENLRREVEMLGRGKDEMEEQILTLMERRDDLEGDVEEIEERVREATEEKDRLEAMIAAAWKEIDGQIARKEARKKDIVPLIPDDLLELYDQLRETKEGVAVGRLADRMCGGCHLRLTPGEELEAKRNDPPRCIHCRRILVP